MNPSKKSIFPFKCQIKYEYIMKIRYKNRTKDDRIKVENTEVFPFNLIGPLVSKQKDKNFYLGTATLIEKNFAITAAHNLYENYYRTPEFYFAPGLNGVETDLEFSRGTEFFLFDSYEKNESSPDIAIIKLEKPLGDYYGHFNLSAYNENLKTLNFYGYPGDRYKQNNFSYNLYGQTVQNITVEQENIRFNCDSYSGMSGSPVFDYNDSSADIYGVFHSHDYINYKQKPGWAVFFTEEILKEIKKYIEENQI